MNFNDNIELIATKMEGILNDYLEGLSTKDEAILEMAGIAIECSFLESVSWAEKILAIDKIDASITIVANCTQKVHQYFDLKNELLQRAAFVSDLKVNVDRQKKGGEDGK
jgi:hypothetical protein